MLQLPSFLSGLCRCPHPYWSQVCLEIKRQVALSMQPMCWCSSRSPCAPEAIQIYLFPSRKRSWPWSTAPELGVWSTIANSVSASIVYLPACSISCVYWLRAMCFTWIKNRRFRLASHGTCTSWFLRCVIRVSNGFRISSSADAVCLMS